MNDSEKELRAAAIEARDYHPNIGVFELTANCAFEIIGELDRLRLRIAELEGARAKAMEGAAPSFVSARDATKYLADYGNRDAIATLAELDRRADVIAHQAAELERLREQCRCMETREDAGNGIIVEQTAEIDRQARELERMRKLYREEIEARTLRPLDEYHEDYGQCLWWEVPVCEPPLYIGSPNRSDWPEDDEYVADWHFTRFMNPLTKDEAAEMLAAAQPSGEETKGNDR